MKICSRCGLDKPVSEYYRHCGTRDGLKTFCKACGRAASSAYYREHAAEQNAKASLRVDKPAKAAYDREYRARNRPKLIRQARERWRIAKEQGRRRSAPSKSAMRERSMRWRLAHPERFRNRMAEYRRTNRAKVSAWAEAYRARRADGDGVTADQWRALISWFGNKCLACGAAERITMDHVMPLSRGGRHEMANVQPLCWSCNTRKKRQATDYRPMGWEARVAELARSSDQMDEPAAAV